ncbi:hypothetical protein [Coleofasciculus chthonoplastes]|jgi:hypothetical protein|uniref:hypothetical protein n=1 Tax=Coleofasciculus TaxID=669368 RepID=UPI0032FCA19D
MVSSGTIHSLGFTCLVAFPFTTSVALLSPAHAQTQVAALPEEVSQMQPEPDDSTELRPLTQEDSLLSLQGGERLMVEANQAIEAQDYTLASQKLQQARQVFNQLSNFYQQLAESFSGIDNRIFNEHRQNALKTAEMRDEATYQLALVHRAQDQPELAVPLLIQIIRSQNPTRDLGKKAYQQLFELGFVGSPFPPSGNSEPTSSVTPER